MKTPAGLCKTSERDEMWSQDFIHFAIRGETWSNRKRDHPTQAQNSTWRSSTNYVRMRMNRRSKARTNRRHASLMDSCKRGDKIEACGHRSLLRIENLSVLELTYDTCVTTYVCVLCRVIRFSFYFTVFRAIYFFLNQCFSYVLTIY